MTAPPDTPVPALDPAKLFTSLSDAAGIVAAVSGGPDSMTLMHLLALWEPAKRPPIVVATVDHGLRPEAAAEARFVAVAAERLGLTHRILAWEEAKPDKGLQEAARDARYHLLSALAREVGASHIVTAHTRDDQAETLLMRLARGSGLAGLSGMRVMRDLDGVHLVRPLLDQDKATLVAHCETEGWSFVTDPSNADEAYTRVRWRKLMPLLAAEGLTAQTLARLAKRAERTNEALSIKADEAFARGWSAGTFQGVVLGEEPFEIALRVLERLLDQGSLEADHRRLDRLETCLERIRTALAAKAALRLTIGGTLLDLRPDGRLTAQAEPPRRRGR